MQTASRRKVKEIRKARHYILAEWKPETAEFDNNKCVESGFIFKVK
jgi:hypothetical protein